MTIFLFCLTLISVFLILLKGFTISGLPSCSESGCFGTPLRISIEKGGVLREKLLLNPGLNYYLLSERKIVSRRRWAPLPSDKGTAILEYQSGTLKVSSFSAIVIAGVKARSGSLRPGEFFRTRSLKITYLCPGRGDTSFASGINRFCLSGMYFSFLVLLTLLMALGTSWSAVPVYASHYRSAAEATVGRPDEKAMEKLGSAESAADVFPRERLRLVAPGETLPDITVDVLFVHAHPDDESLDYGTLLATMQKKGLTTAVLLLTDGESGIFREDYSGPRGNLSDLRLNEVKSALGILGCDLYIRFGLPNHPYNGLNDELTCNKVLKSWGGSPELAARIAEVIFKLKPRLLVAPDGPSAAREHFEHESTGIVVRDALDYMRKLGRVLPSGYILAVDPRQHELYPGAVPVSRDPVLETQTAALQSHQTQADAAVFGVDMVRKIRSEFYAVSTWTMDITPELFLGL